MGSVDSANLSCSLRVVVEKMASPIIKEFQSRWGVDEDLKKLRKFLLKMQAVLNDAEQKQTGNAMVKEWLDGLKALVCNAKEVLDLYATQIGIWNQMCESSNSSSSSTNVNKLKKRFCIDYRLEEIIKNSEELAMEKDELRLKADVVARPTTGIGGRRRETSSFVDASRVYGRDSEKGNIVELLLLSDGPSEGNGFGVLPIVGMAGIGKTTLAQLVYNEERVGKHFDLKAWVCVSEEFNVGRITKAILELVSGEACDLVRLDALQIRLKDALKGKRFLIVLDDVWSENFNDWENLRIPFKFGKQGSKILVTSRSEVVSKMMGTISAHSLAALTSQ